MGLTIHSRVELNNGVMMPVLGLGVFRIPQGEGTRNAVKWALDAGYRHIDTAAIYGNEEDVGAALRESGVPRDEVFVTTKLWNNDQGYYQALTAYEVSRERLGLDVLDLYLIHWPVESLRKESWRGLEKMLAMEQVRAVGVSNFAVRHLEELMASSSVVPAVNQIEVSPFLQQRDVIAFCRRHNIQVVAYSPLTKGRKLHHPVIQTVAERLGRSPAQILIRWAIQKGLCVIPKSGQKDHIVENAAVFDFTLDNEEMARLDDLEEGLHTSWNPNLAP